MHRQIIVLFLSLVFLALPSAWGADRGALFKVTAKGHTMYLFGTMHVGQPGFYPLEDTITGALAKASTLALEIDPLGDPAALQAALQAHGMATSANAQAAMPAPLRERLRRVLAKAGIDAVAVSRFKPWLVATILAMGEYGAQGYRADLSVDMHLAQLARSNKVPVISLETPQLQMGLFSRLSDADQLSFLEESLTLIENGKQSEEVRQIVAAWGSADRAMFEQIAERAAKDTTVAGRFVKNVLLDERNVGLADKLARLLEKEVNTVAAIGVLHLVGGNSVPALLSARGASVERIY
ncbi:MAG: TraB/GumN family protein [Pseudomonadota bacterium]